MSVTWRARDTTFVDVPATIDEGLRDEDEGEQAVKTSLDIDGGNADQERTQRPTTKRPTTARTASQVKRVEQLLVRFVRNQLLVGHDFDSPVCRLFSFIFSFFVNLRQLRRYQPLLLFLNGSNGIFEVCFHIFVWAALHVCNYFSRGDAIDVHLERFGAQIAPDWKTEDLAALFARLRSSHCSIEGIRMFADDFKNTTEEEIMDVIENLKKLINKAEANRFIHRNYEVLGITRTDEVEPSTSNKFADVNYAANASEAASRAASVVKSVHMKRKLRSTASDRIKDVLKEFAKEADAKITVKFAKEQMI